MGTFMNDLKSGLLIVLSLGMVAAVAACLEIREQRNQLSDVVRMTADHHPEDSIYDTCTSLGIDTLELKNWVYSY